MKIVYAHDHIAPHEVIRFLTITGQADSIFKEIVKMKEAVKRGKELNIVVSDEELQRFADSFRAARGLRSARETLQFFEDAGINADDFEWFCEASLLTASLEDHIAGDHEIAEYFIVNRSQLDLARIAVALVQDENVANEIVMQVNEDGKDFHALARQYSVDEATRYAGGYVGLITRNMLPPEVAVRVFNATAGDLLGPFQRGELFQVILVEEVIKAELSAEVKEVIKKRIFDEWISQFMKGGVKIVS